MQIRSVSDSIPVDPNSGLVLHGSPYVVDGGVYQAFVRVEHKIISADNVAPDLLESLILWQRSGWRASGGITWDGRDYHILLIKEF